LRHILLWWKMLHNQLLLVHLIFKVKMRHPLNNSLLIILLIIFIKSSESKSLLNRWLSSKFNRIIPSFTIIMNIGSFINTNWMISRSLFYFLNWLSDKWIFLFCICCYFLFGYISIIIYIITNTIFIGCLL